MSETPTNTPSAGLPVGNADYTRKVPTLADLVDQVHHILHCARRLEFTDEAPGGDTACPVRAHYDIDSKYLCRGRA